MFQYGKQGGFSVEKRDKVIIGAGLYGLYAALYCGRRGQRVTVL